MQYLKPNVCKQLEAMGLVSDSGMVWDLSDGAYELEPENGIIWQMFAPAFTISDILLNADNARKLFGNDSLDCDCSHECDCKCLMCREGWDLFRLREAHSYQHQVYKLIKLVHEGTDIEPELQKAIESKPL